MSYYREMVREERKKQKITQKTMSDELGVSLPTYKRFEGEGHCSLDLFLRVCNKLRISIIITRDVTYLTKPPQ